MVHQTVRTEHLHNMVCKIGGPGPTLDAVSGVDGAIAIQHPTNTCRTNLKQACVALLCYLVFECRQAVNCNDLKERGDAAFQQS